MGAAVKRGGGLESAVVGIALTAAALWVGGANALGAYLFLASTFFVGFIAVVRRNVEGLMVALVSIGIGFPVLQAGVPFGYRLPPVMIVFLVMAWRLRGGGVKIRIPNWLGFFLGLLVLGTLNYFRLYAQSQRSYAVSQLLWLGAELAVAWLALSWGRDMHGEPGRQVFSSVGFSGIAILLVPLLLSLSTRIGTDQGIDPNGVALLADQATLAFVLLYLLWPSVKTVVALAGGVSFCMVVLIDAASRQGIVIALAVFGTAIIASTQAGKKLKAFAVVFIVAVVVWNLAAVGKKQYVRGRFNKITQQGENISRVAHLRVAISIAAENPLGMGSAGFRYGYWKHARAAGIFSAERFPRPHGLLTMALADWGIPGGLLFLLSMGFLGLEVFRATGKAGALRKTAFVVLLLGSFAATRVPLFALALAAFPGRSRLAAKRFGPEAGAADRAWGRLGGAL